MVNATALLTAAVSLVAAVAHAAPSSGCNEALKYGETTSKIVGVEFKAGESYSVDYDFSCALDHGYTPKSVFVVFQPNFAKAVSYIVGKQELSITTAATKATVQITVPKTSFSQQGYTFWTEGIYDASGIEIFSGFGGEALNITAASN